MTKLVVAYIIIGFIISLILGFAVGLWAQLAFMPFMVIGGAVIGWYMP